MSSQDINEHNVSNDSHHQPLYKYSDGQSIPLSKLKMQTKAIANFITEFFTIPCQQQNSPPDNPPTILPLVCNVSS